MKITVVIFTPKNIQLKRKKKKEIRQAHKKNECINVEEERETWEKCEIGLEGVVL